MGTIGSTIGPGTISAPRAGVCETTFVGQKDFDLSVGWGPNGRWVVKIGPTSLLRLLMIVISAAFAPVAGGKVFATGSGDCRARICSYELK